MPILASTSRVQMRAIVETTFGVTPVAGNPSNLRMTGESLDFALVKTSDKEIRSDRQMTSTTTTDANVTGDIKFHMQYAEFDRLFGGLMQNPWVVFGTNGVGATFTSSTTLGVLGVTASQLTASAATSGSSIFTGLQRGQWFKLTGDVANTKAYRVSSTIDPTSTVIVLDVNTPMAATTSLAGVAITASRLSNGVTMPSFTLERAMNDIGQFMTYRGCAVGKFATAFTAQQLTEGTFSFMGKDMVRNVATQMPGSPIASQTYDLQNAVKGVGNIWEGGAPLSSTSIKSLTLSVDNTLRAQEAIGVLGLAGIGVGTFKASGNLELYFADGTIYDKFLTDTYTSFTVSSMDTAGNGYVFSVPRAMLTSGKIVAGGKDSDLLASFSWEAFADLTNVKPALQCTMFIDRVGAAVLP